MPVRAWSVALLCVAALTVGATPLAACDPMWLAGGRPDGISIVVAMALADTVLDGAIAAGLGRLHIGFGSRVHQGLGETRGGQRVRLLRWSESGAPPAREAVLVPWAYAEDCRPIAWRGRLRWMGEGARGAVTGWLRPEQGWIGGLPTFDVEMAWREPVWAEGEPRWIEAGSSGRRMTPEEFVELYSALPSFELQEHDPAAARRRLRDWEREHADLAKLAPGATILAGLRRRLGL
jgi:hypothetical protein